MISVRVDQISPTPSGLALGLTIRYGEDGPIRFARAEIPWNEWSPADRADTLAAFNRMIGDTLAAEREYEAPQEPLF